MADADSDRPLERRPGLAIPIEVTAITAILALALAVMAAAGAALYQRSRPPSYVAAAVLLIDQPIQVAVSPDAGELQKLQLLRYVYASLTKTDVIAGPAATQLHLNEGLVAGELNTFVDPTSFTMNVTATSKTPQQAVQVAQAGAQAMISYVAKQQRHLSVQPNNRVVFHEVTTPLAALKLTASRTKIWLSAAVAFVVVGGAFLIVADLLRRRR